MIGFRVDGAMLTDRGVVRSANEDRVAYGDRLDTTGDLVAGLAVVADGMGGHAAGETASELAVEILQRGFWIGTGSPAERLATCMLEANAAIHQEAKVDPTTAGMGTTCTALAFQDGRAWLAHVGDSRAYLVRDGELRQLTEDQTLVGRMVKDGLISPEEALDHPDRNIILQALGTEPEVRPAIDADGMDVADGDIFVLCSDGLTNMVADSTIRDICLALPPFSACERLIGAAIAAGGTDNISVGVFNIRVPRRADAVSTTRRLSDLAAAEPAPRVTRRIALPGGEP